jgi:leader peptidase (prepilin peptidase)/N-methyltransferase
MSYIVGCVVFLFGSALGSFVAVIADRYNTGLSFFKGRSICFSCNHELQSKDLVPMFSFLFLKGKCRYCKSKIPASTFVAEIIMGLLTLLVAMKIGIFDNFPARLAIEVVAGGQFLTFNFLILISIFATILLISLYDLRHFIIPDAFLIGLFILSIFYLSISNFSIISNSVSFTSYLVSLASGIVLAIPFLLIFLISKGTWFGFGDVKYIVVLGFFLGLAGGLSAVVLAFWIGAVFAILAMVLKKLTPFINLPLLQNNLTIKSEIPFGPFLSLGIVISFYLSLDIFHIYELFNIF